MGNCVSANSGLMAPRIRVVQALEGRVVDVELPPLQSSMTVGELMLEFPPGHFVALINFVKPAVSASNGTRATPLVADANATPGTVYVLFPMPRLHTRITPQELLTFSKLIHRQDQQLTKPAHNPSKVNVFGLFTGGARVAPLVEEEGNLDAHQLDHSSTAEYTKEQACQLTMKQQMSYKESSSCILSPCHGHMGVVRARPWAPTLQTIMESS